MAVESIEPLHPSIRKAGKELKKLSIVSTIDEAIKKEEEMFDYIIFSNILCKIPNPKEALQKADAVLAPGGKVFFSEHIGRPAGTWTRTFQNVCNPIWCHAAGGCNCNRDTVELIRQMKGWEVISWQYEHKQIISGPFVLGLAVKK